MLLIRNAELNGYLNATQVVDVRCRDGVITEVGAGLLPRAGETVVDARGAALLPGLHDHHLHLLATAAAQTSVPCGPDACDNRAALQQALRTAPGSGWIRAVDYHESIAGELDRQQLDQLVPNRPLRLQHRSGILWILNSLAIEQLHLEKEYREGLERDSQGHVTGRLFRLDAFLQERLQERLGRNALPDLNSLSQQLARYGITGVTDTGANNDASTLGIFERAIQEGQFQQRIVLMGNESLPESTIPLVHRGALKILLDEFQLPQRDALWQRIQVARQQQRAVAFHCVTEAQLVFALSILQDAGAKPGDRIEHASLCPDEVLPLLKATGVAIVTQPGLLRSRGLEYRREVPVEDHTILYRVNWFEKNHIPLALSSDTPYGQLDPWYTMQAAVERSNSEGYVFGPAEKTSAEAALLGYLRHPLDLSRLRSVAVGSDADFCLLDRPWSVARRDLTQVVVRQTFVAGKKVTSCGSAPQESCVDP